ncbi:MAG: MATE family efflux transporter [Fusobacteriaceae bacterium]
MMDQKYKLMETGDMTKLLIKFSVPAMMGLIINALYNVVDRMFIGRIPETGHFAIAGLGLVMPFNILAFSVAMLFVMGGSTLVSIRLGEKKNFEAEVYLGNAISSGFIFGILLTVFTMIFLDPAVIFLGASENTFAQARQYLQIVSFGFPFIIAGATANSIIRSDGSPKISMITMLIGAILNTILDPIFIFGFGMGVAGAAYATVISQMVSMIWAVYYFISPRSGLKLRFKNMIINAKILWQLIKQGSAQCLLQLGQGVIMFVFNNTLKRVSGDYAIGAMTIVMTINMFFVMPMLGINQGILPLIGYNYGAKLFTRVKGILKRAIIAASILGTFAFIVLQLFTKYWIFIFTTDTETIRLATYGLRISTVMFPVIGFQIVSAIYFQSIGRPKITMLLSLSRQVLFLIPLILVMSNFFGLFGVWIAGPMSDALSAMLNFFLLRKELKHLRELELL